MKRPLAPLKLEDILYDPDDDRINYTSDQAWPLLADALNELPDEQREVFVMHELEDFSFKEIEDMTGVPLNTLISRKRYAIFFKRKTA
jgi:DNA-directed RNA polymerase specialized sigma24 family protein